MTKINEQSKSSNQDETKCWYIDVDNVIREFSTKYDFNFNGIIECDIFVFKMLKDMVLSQFHLLNDRRILPLHYKLVVESVWSQYFQRTFLSIKWIPEIILKNMDLSRKFIFNHAQGRRTSQCHRAMALVVFLPRLEAML